MVTVSAIIPTYDRDTLVLRAIRSMVEQTHSPIELIVVDDHSPTPVQEVLERSNIDPDPITVHRHDDNKGGNAARNTGIDLASGDYLAFLDDDDKWVDIKIERQLQRAQNTEAGVVYTGVEQVSNGKTIATKTPDITGDVTIDPLTGNFIGTFSTILMRQDLVEDVGYPDDEFPSWHDWDYYLRLSEETAFESIAEPLVRRHSDGQEQLSHDHATKRDVTVPLFLDKHRPRATNTVSVRSLNRRSPPKWAGPPLLTTSSSRRDSSISGRSDNNPRRKHCYF